MAHPELGARILDGVIEAVGPMAKVENQARLEGRSMSMVLAPDKKAQDALKKAESLEAAPERKSAPAEPEEPESTDANNDLLSVQIDSVEKGETDAEDENLQDGSETL